MNNQSELSNVTKKYINKFQCILDEMIYEMTNADLTYSISDNFIVQMIPHHQAAIEMSRNILKYTTNIPLQNIALRIIEEQTKSIENMLNIKYKCAKLTNPKQDVYFYQLKVNQIMQTMFYEMENAYTNNQINADFIREMIPHHQGAIKMSVNALKYDICPELKPILNAIISSQEKGIEQMQQLLQDIDRNI